MAYQSGSVQNTFELFDRFEAFLTGSGGPGWNLVATTTLDSAGTGSTDARDKVFFSSGSNGAKSLTYRATFLNPDNMNTSSYGQGITSSIGTKAPDAVHNVFDYIVFRGYQNWNLSDTSTNGGTGSFGTLGPAIYQFPNRSPNQSRPGPISVLNYSSSTSRFNPLQQVDETMWGFETGGSYLGNNQAMWGWFDAPPYKAYHAGGLWDGRRRNYYVSNHYQAETTNNWDSYTSNYLTVGAYDLANGNNQRVKYDESNGPYLQGDDDYQMRQCVLVYDKATQKEFVYYNAYSETNWWRKVNLKTGEITLLTNPGKGTNSQHGYAYAWDGEDTIYKFDHYNGSEFEKYSISGDSWTALTNVPAAPQPDYNGQTCGYPTMPSYIPASASVSTLTSSLGTTTDVIFMARANTTTCYRYDVVNNNWITDIATPATFQNRYDSMWWDGDVKLWYHDYSASKIYYRDFSTNDGYHTWVEYVNGFMNSSTPYSGSTETAMMRLEGPCSKIRGQQQSFYVDSATKMNYWFQGNQDYINVVTETSGNYYWAHFGTYDSIVSTNTMRSTAAFTSGDIVTVPVDSTTGFVTGQEIIIADVSGSATVEKSKILQVVDGTNIKVANLANSFASGTFIGTDPHQAVATGDSFLAVTSLDGDGYRTDGMSSMYRVTPTVPFQLMRATNTNAQGFYTPWPLVMYNNTRNLSTYETKGMLKGCWVMLVGEDSYPSLISGDTLNVEGTSYKVFPLEETTTLMGNNIDKLLLLIKTE